METSTPFDALADRRATRRSVAVEGVVHEPRAGRRGQELGAKADQARASGCGSRDAPARCRRRPCHVELARRSAEQLLHDRPGAAPRCRRSGCSHGSQSSRRRSPSVDDLRPRDRELVALAAHVLDQDRQVQLAAPGDLEAVGGRRYPRPGGRRCGSAPGSRRSRRICRLVTNLPSRPANGELLTWKVMVMVGSSTTSGGQRLGTARDRRGCRRC